MITNVIHGVLPRGLGTAVCAIAMLLMAGCGDVYVHEEFDKLTMRKSEAEVVSLIGKPVSVDANNPAHVVWTYYAKTFDIENQNKRDIKAVVIFEPDAASHELRVIKVEYQRG